MKYNIEYKDKSDFGCGMTIEAPSEHLAIIRLVEILLKEDNYMSKLTNIYKNEY
tara:strand:+ start:293 stop:454 length:162 start_codon:yes stop_codon:yes gene_type:complete